MDVGDPTFIFTLTGTDVYGKKHSYEKKSNSQRQRLENRMKDQSGRLIELSVTFDDLEYGTYTCNEGGMIKYFKLLNITSNKQQCNDRSGERNCGRSILDQLERQLKHN